MGLKWLCFILHVFFDDVLTLYNNTYSDVVVQHSSKNFIHVAILNIIISHFNYCGIECNYILNYGALEAFFSSLKLSKIWF